MSIQNILRIESDTITEQSVKIPFEFENKTSVPAGKDVGDCIVIRPITVRTWFKIRPFLLQIDKEDLNKIIVKADDINIDFSEVMARYDELIVDIVCLGIHNKPSDPPEWFKQVLIDNTTWEDIRILLNAILYRIGYYPFCKSITTLQSVSPIGELEMIAAQKNLESWQH